MSVDESLLLFLDALGREDSPDPYPDTYDPLPYPPTGAVIPRTTGKHAGAQGSWLDERIFDSPDDVTLHADCVWTSTSITVTWRVVNPAPETFAQLGIGLLDDPSSERWHSLGPPQQDEQTCEIDESILGFSPEDCSWWYLIVVGQGSVSDVDP